MENFGSALVDATKAIEAKEDFPKGWYRRGSAQMALGRPKEALKDFMQLCKLAPNDKDAREKLKQCQKQVQADKFAKAIGCEKTKPASETVDVAMMGQCTSLAHAPLTSVSTSWSIRKRSSALPRSLPIRLS